TAKWKESWALLDKLSRLSRRPWLVAGDFNEILYQKEKIGSHHRPLWRLNNFRKCLETCNLANLGYEGSQFTWCNHREEPHTIRARLDRACASVEWLVFPETRVRHIPSLQSDHSAILVETVHDQQLVQKKKRFRFEAMWLRSPDCEEVVRKHWGGPSQGSAIQAF
ncbi:UNVERIFIED_CONTAM: hypothetical protein Slati_3410400, partial [Sesamum latifolium]